MYKEGNPYVDSGAINTKKRHPIQVAFREV